MLGKSVNWIKLKVLESVIESTGRGYVEFEASFVDGSHLKFNPSKSEFIFEKGRWYYVGGKHLPTDDTEQMIARTMNCPCGSNRKFKNCHGT